jgi:hypothetical protein
MSSAQVTIGLRDGTRPFDHATFLSREGNDRLREPHRSHRATAPICPADADIP